MQSSCVLRFHVGKTKASSRVQNSLSKILAKVHLRYSESSWRILQKFIMCIPERVHRVTAAGVLAPCLGELEDGLEVKKASVRMKVCPDDHGVWRRRPKCLGHLKSSTKRRHCHCIFPVRAFSCSQCLTTGGGRGPTWTVLPEE